MSKAGYLLIILLVCISAHKGLHAQNQAERVLQGWQFSQGGALESAISLRQANSADGQRVSLRLVSRLSELDVDCSPLGTLYRVERRLVDPRLARSAGYTRMELQEREGMWHLGLFEGEKSTGTWKVKPEARLADADVWLAVPGSLPKGGVSEQLVLIKKPLIKLWVRVQHYPDLDKKPWGKDAPPDRVLQGLAAWGKVQAWVMESTGLATIVDSSRYWIVTTTEAVPRTVAYWGGRGKGMEGMIFLPPPLE